jgi:hypothetical protein
MADLAVTASEVRKGTDGNIKSGTAASTITAGQPLYLNTSDKLAPCDADGDATTSLCVGIALHAALAEQPIQYQNGGSMTIGATAAMTQGEIYVTSDTAGGIRPVADIDSGDYISVLGVASSTAILKMPLTGVFNSQVVK